MELKSIEKQQINFANDQSLCIIAANNFKFTKESSFWFNCLFVYFSVHLFVCCILRTSQNKNLMPFHNVSQILQKSSKSQNLHKPSKSQKDFKKSLIDLKESQKFSLIYETNSQENRLKVPYRSQNLARSRKSLKI